MHIVEELCKQSVGPHDIFWWGGCVGLIASQWKSRAKIKSQTSMKSEPTWRPHVATNGSQLKVRNLFQLNLTLGLQFLFSCDLNIKL